MKELREELDKYSIKVRWIGLPGKNTEEDKPRLYMRRLYMRLRKPLKNRIYKFMNH